MLSCGIADRSPLVHGVSGSQPVREPVTHAFGVQGCGTAFPAGGSGRKKERDADGNEDGGGGLVQLSRAPVTPALMP